MGLLPKEASRELQGRKDSWTQEEREGKGRGGKGPGNGWALCWEKAGAHVMHTALEYRRWVTHRLYALSLEEKDHRGLGCLSVGSSVFVIELFLLLQRCPNQPQKRQPWC